MFKVICYIEKLELKKVLKQLPPYKNIAPSAKKYDSVIKYNSCEACNIHGLGLTSTNTKPSLLAIESAIEACNNNILNPTNPLYYNSYRKLLNKDLTPYFNNNNIIYITIFGTDDGLLPSKPCYLWFQVFETIINIQKPITYPEFNKNGYTTGYEELHTKFSDILVTNKTHNTFIELDTVDRINDYNYTAKHAAIAYYLHKKGILHCEKDFYRKVTSSQEYIKFIKIDLIQSFINNLCKTHSKLPNSAECDIGFIYETTENICSYSDSDLATNGVFSITCHNFKDFLATYEVQKILGTNTHYENIIG